MASSFHRPSAQAATEKERLLTPVMGYGSGDLNGGPLDLCSLGSQQQQQDEEEALRRKLKYFFMSPCDKYHAKGRKPYKLALQLLKIIIVTVQLVMFGLSNQMVVAFKEENTDSFKHLFLRDYVEDSQEPLCLHTQKQVHEHIRYAIDQMRCNIAGHNQVDGEHLSLSERSFISVLPLFGSLILPAKGWDGDQRRASWRGVLA